MNPELMKEAEQLLDDMLCNPVDGLPKATLKELRQDTIESIARQLAERDARLLEEAARALIKSLEMARNVYVAEGVEEAIGYLRSRAAAIRNGLSTTKQEG